MHGAAPPRRGCRLTPREQNGGVIGFGAGIREKALLQCPGVIFAIFSACHDVCVGIEAVDGCCSRFALRVHFAVISGCSTPRRRIRMPATEIRYCCVKIPQVLHLPRSATIGC